MNRLDDNMTRRGLFLQPLDVLFFRDGRPFDHSDHARSVLPQPQTLAGALTTHLLKQAGVDFEQWRNKFKDAGGDMRATLVQFKIDEAFADLRVRGPWLAEGDGDGSTPKVYLKAPVILAWEKRDKPERMYRFAPLPPGDLPPGWKLLEDHHPLWIRKPEIGDSVDGFLDFEGMNSFLHGEAVSKDHHCESGKLYSFDNRTGIGIDPATLSVEKGLIYSVRMLALKPRIGFYAELDLPSSLADAAKSLDGAVLHWGGEGRRVTVHRVEPVRWPSNVNGTGKTAYVLVSPGRFSAGWQPDTPPQGADFVTASVLGHSAVSGWDLAKGGPKPTRFTVPVGSVYFYENDNNSDIYTFSESPENLREGWGLVLQGVWDYA